MAKDLGIGELKGTKSVKLECQVRIILLNPSLKYTYSELAVKSTTGLGLLIKKDVR